MRSAPSARKDRRTEPATFASWLLHDADILAAIGRDLGRVDGAESLQARPSDLRVRQDPLVCAGEDGAAWEVCAKEIVAAADRAKAIAIPRSLFMRHRKLVHDGRTVMGR